ncbi:MAG: UDP-galactopyranose mutase [Lachnospiraceae bacterium]|nr:UDP-galactopyranose mutase [Lachnospiraceae bacterium]
MFDYLVVGAGLFGAVFAGEARKAGKRVLVLERRDHIAGNVYTEKAEGINIHRYGAHIFHTSNDRVWKYVNEHAVFNRFTNSPLARYKDELFNLPFNMNTFHALWGVVTPEEAREKIAGQIEEVKRSGITEPKNLEEQALLLGGHDIYEKLIKGYTEKQWGRRADELPAFIIRRLPFRFTYDNNYFEDRYQGIPMGGYTRMVEDILDGVEVRTGIDYLKVRNDPEYAAETVVFTGMTDEFFDHRLGKLEYRSLRFEDEIKDVPDYQGNAVINYTEFEVPYTRVIEHRHFEPENTEASREKTVITKEYPLEWAEGREPYYAVNDEKNNALYKRYEELAKREKNVIFGGRLGQYRYFDMDDTIDEALKLSDRILR